MRTLKIEKMGEDAQGVKLRGDRRNPEPVHFRVSFPGGDIEIVRASDTENPDYWIHVRVNGSEDCVEIPGRKEGAIVGARLDIRGKHVSETDVGDFENPDLYHLAVRVRANKDGA